MAGPIVTYSRKLFLPLTHLCRDVCHYCTFARPASATGSPFMSVDEAVAGAKAAAAVGCKEALLTLGERPEARWRVAREALDSMGFESTIDYVIHVAGRLVAEAGILPHVNAGTLTDAEIRRLRDVSPSMGMMLETVATRLSEKGGPHYGSPDKDPEVRLETLRLAGEANVPFTSGILIGIGETRAERLSSLEALCALHERYGHLQEIILQSFRPKPGTRMAESPEPSLEELLWTIQAARDLFGDSTAIQVPPNLSPNALRQLLDAGIDDWGGISPVTPDYVNPEAPWPNLADLERTTAKAGKALVERLTIYPRYALDAERWVAPRLRQAVLARIDADGLAREDRWLAGESRCVPPRHAPPPGASSPALRASLAKAVQGSRLDEGDVTRLFSARGGDVALVRAAADAVRRELVGNDVTYVVNRNINYTNVCTFGCRFCAFSKGRRSDGLRGPAYNLPLDEIARRADEAWRAGATEVCLQGGIHPGFTGDTYLAIVEAVRTAVPDIHIHAFSPLEVRHGAATLGLAVADFLAELKTAGLGSLPGTAAEIFDPEVRRELCPTKLTGDDWLDIVATAHALGLPTTATIMFGHIDRPVHWARHLLAILELQRRTGGFTEFVPLPYVASAAPLYLSGRSRRGPTFREAVLMHSIARLVFGADIPNIQASWVKMGPAGVLACLESGANDFGGTLTNESITRAAGALHGQELSGARISELVRGIGRTPRQRTTLYGRPRPIEGPGFRPGPSHRAA